MRWRSLAANLDQLEFPSVNSLIAFLAQVAEQKVIDEYRRQHTLKRDITRDGRSSVRIRMTAPVQLSSDDPTASQLAQANEVARATSVSPDETERTIIDLKQKGTRRRTSPSRPAGIFARCSVS